MSVSVPPQLEAPDLTQLSLVGDGSAEAARLIAAAEHDRLASIERVEAVVPGVGIGESAQYLGVGTARLLRSLVPAEVLGTVEAGIDSYTRTGDLRMPFAGYVEPHDPLTHPLPPDLLAQIPDGTIRILEPYLGVAALDSGLTFVYNSVDSRLPETIRDLVDDLATATRSNVQINAYVSRGNAPGFGLHWDDHDVLIMQVSGRKYWEVCKPAVVGALRQLTPDSTVGEVVWSGILEPGAALVIPRGWAHRVQGFAEETSVHLTFGVSRLTIVGALALVDPSRLSAGVAPTVEDLAHAIGQWRSQAVCLPRQGIVDAARSVSSGLASARLRIRLLCGAIFVADQCTDEELVLMANRRCITMPRKAVDALAWLLEHPNSSMQQLEAAVGRPDVNLVTVLRGFGESGLLHATPIL